MNNIVVEDTKDREMTNEEYRIELQKLFEGIDNNRLLRYFYISSFERIQQEKAVDYQVPSPNYRELIIEIIGKIDNEKLLIKIFDYINAWLN